jgi:hypothetical protein
MTHTKPVVMTTCGGQLACYVPAVPGWEGVEKLWRYLEINFAAECISRSDGPDARRWIVKVRGMMLEIHHEDPWGNTIVSCSRESDDVLFAVAADLERRLAVLG